MAPIAGSPIQAKDGQENIKDGQWHDVWIKYSERAQWLSVYFDDEQTARLSAGSVLLRSIVSSDIAYWGFTGSTGELVNDQKVKIHKSSFLKYV